jgi:Predicted Fe-S oxidoreductases
MCHVWANESSQDELSFEEIKNIIDQAVAWGIPEINLCGGEPLLSPVCFPVIQYAKEKGMKVILTSNGTVINETIAKKIVDLKVDVVCVSLDGATAATHDTLRGLEGAYEKILRGIGLISQYRKDGFPVRVLILTLHNENLDEVVDYIYLAKKLNIDALYITSLVLDNVKLYEHKEESPLWIKGDRLKKLDEVVDTLVSLEKEYYGFGYPSFNLIKKYFRGEVIEKDWVCFAGFRRFVVCPDGNIMMCGEIIGHVRQERDIRKLWRA